MAHTEAVEIPRPFRLPAAMQRPSVSMQRRVQFAAMLQLGDSGRAYWATTAAICRGTDRRDLEAALIHLVDDRSITGPTCRLDSLVTLAEAGLLELTVRGRLRLDEDDF